VELRHEWYGTVIAGCGERGRLRGFAERHRLRAACRHGKVIWQRTIGTRILSSPAVASGLVYIGVDELLVALSAGTGVTVWAAPTFGSANFSSPAVANGLVCIGSLVNRVWAFGALDWPMFHHSPTISGLNAAEATISPANVGTLVAAWTACPTCDVLDPVVANGVAYAGVFVPGAACGAVLVSPPDCLVAFDATTGAQL
jgi:outer membrane protein assembly factor BamB